MAGVRRSLGDLARRVALDGGRWLDSTTPEAHIAEFLGRARPMRGAHPLVRIGPAGDGGYVLPDDLDGITGCISPGVSDGVGFDLAMAERGVTVVMADASVHGPPIDHPLFQFQARHLDVVTSNDTIRLDDLVADVVSVNAREAGSGDLILQMDIEGAEYVVLLDASDATLKRFRVLLIEFHGLPNLFSKFGFGAIDATFRKLLRFHYVAHIHPNNCCGAVRRGEIELPWAMEFTFHRRDRGFTGAPARGPFPHPLDARNVPDNPSLPLAPCWFSVEG